MQYPTRHRRSKRSSDSWMRSPSGSTPTGAPSAASVDATIAYCDYVFRRYGRFPAYTAPFRTIIGYQAGYIDVDFYERFYGRDARPDAVRACTERALREGGHGAEAS